MSIRRTFSYRNYSETDTRRWLASIASRMQAHGETVLRLEQLQPSWFVHRHEYALYVLLSRAVVGLLVGIAAGALDTALSSGLPEISAGDIADRFWAPVRWGIVAGISTGIGTLFNLKTKIRDRLRIKSAITTHFVFAIIGALVAMLGLLVYIGFGRLIGLDYETQHRTVMIMIAVITGLLGVRSIGRSFGADIQSTETLGWSWNHVIPGVIAGAVVGFGLGCYYSFYVTGLESSLAVWARVFVLTMVGFVIGGAFHGYVPTARPLASVPNQGIRLSGKRSLIFGVILGLISGGAWGICIGIEKGDGLLGFRTFLYGFVGIYLFAGFWFGGLDVMRHTLLRVMLSFFGYMPLRLVGFLDFAESRLAFLKRDGGGYQFMHRYLQEHFANQSEFGGEFQSEHHGDTNQNNSR